MIGIGAALTWMRRADEPFVDRRYSRVHRWRFDGGMEIAASASPHIVPVPYTAAEAVDPEEAFVAAIASCHLLVFLDIAAQAGFVVDSYADSATAIMEKDADGLLHVSRATLRPRVQYAYAAPSLERERQMHQAAHERCFIARSVRTQISIELQAAT